MRMTFLSCGLALEIFLTSGCAQTPLLEDFDEAADSDPLGVTRRDAGSRDDAGAGRDAASSAGSTRDAGAKKDAAAGKDAGSEDEDGAGEDAGAGDPIVDPIKDAAAPKDASGAPAAGRDAALAVDARVALPNEPPADASVPPRDAGKSVPDASADASTMQANQCVPQQCPPCLLLATACCNSSNVCACRIGIGPCTLPAL
jgi:hypothetical protein